MTPYPNQPAPKARGTGINPPNRFEKLHLETDETESDDDLRPTLTEFYQDDTQSIIAWNDSPDVGFDASVNPYRGCEHGCVYCYARPMHEYLGFSSGLDFESKIMVKRHAPALLRKQLASKNWKPQVIAMSGATDCYQPVERKLKLTRSCLEVLAEFRNPVGIVTKNHLVTRDIDLLSKLAKYQAVIVYISLTTLDRELRRKMEPRTSPPASRLSAIRELNAAGIPVGTILGPVIPGLTDTEIPLLVNAAAGAGARFAHYIMLRLPRSVSPLFEDWLEQNYPLKKERVLNRIRSIRDGKLNSAKFGNRMRGDGIHAAQINNLFKLACKKAGISNRSPELSTAHFRNPENRQMNLFEES